MTYRNRFCALTLIIATMVGCSSGVAYNGGGADTEDEPDDVAAAIDSGGTTEIAPDTPTGEGPTCFEALTCLVDLKNWSGGEVIPSESDCLDDIDDQEMGDVDALLSCVDAKCSEEFVAFEGGGDLELGALYLCIMEDCAESAAVCIGGQGEDDCSDALWCLAGCNPYAQGCTTGCIAETSQTQAEKTGKFLQCVLDVCPLADFQMSCVPASCALKCPELI